MKKLEFEGKVIEREVTDSYTYCEYITDIDDMKDDGGYFSDVMEPLQGKRVRITVEVIEEGME